MLQYGALGWTLLILVACLFPGNELPGSSVPLADKWVHFVLFGIQVLLCLLALRHPAAKKIFTIALCCVLFGILVEILQRLTSRLLHRAFDPMDMVANTIGVLIGVMVYLPFRKNQHSAKR